MAPGDLDVLPAPRSAATATGTWRQPRYELRLLRSDAPHRPLVVRSRHRFRLLAEWSRRLEADHLALLPGCDLVVVDVRREQPPLAVVTPLATPAEGERVAA